jgi:hypothetical protein
MCEWVCVGVDVYVCACVFVSVDMCITHVHPRMPVRGEGGGG